MKRTRRRILKLMLCITMLTALTVTSIAVPKSTIKDEVIKLLNADIEESVILEFIKKNGTPDVLTADEIIKLKKIGASEKVLLALMPAGSKTKYPFKLDDKHKVDKPSTHEVMAVYPIRRHAPVEVGSYLTLDEANAKKVVVIKEKGEGTVAIVTIYNKGRLPIYISAGEIIIGGKQDRMVAYDVIIQPSKEMTIEVRCVEQGRWRGSKKEFSTANAMGNLKSRVAVQFKKQGDVWNEVAIQNAAVNARTRTSTYKATLESSKVKKLTENYKKAILPSLEGRHVVGMVVAINGEVHAIEMYGSPGLFSKMKEKLLKAYVLDVIGVKNENKQAPKPEAILKFYKNTMKEQQSELKVYLNNSNMYRTSMDAENNDSMDINGNLMRRQLLKK